ncbi:hypothetical protein F6J84_14745 [Microbacterium caowuchunii]|uniref:hypothetical protein n=1 Tax=Microbacterium caowuchunii TaxID=2614638 RepID=UPI001243BA5D|nr:hypothetical protein [Microbacterium caowuchunii]QEW01229.1 hypothetical protein F6J84_14745 [Microbacterium caowuchunii]
MTAAEPPAPTEQNPKDARPNRRFLWIALIVVVALVVAAAVVWVVQLPKGTPSAVATVGGVEVRFEPAETPEDAAYALSDLQNSAYLALHPFQRVGDGELPEGDGELRSELPVNLPEGAIATFAYYDAESASWMPAPTSIGDDLRTIRTAVSSGGASADPAAAGPPVMSLASTGTAASRATTVAVPTGPLGGLWTIVVTGTAAAVEAANSALNEAGVAAAGFVEDLGENTAAAWADFSSDFALGSQWAMRATHVLLGNSADIPECEPDSEGAVPWVQDSLKSDNAAVSGFGLDGGNAAVLICVGPDPDDSSRLQVRAAANRSYGFPVVFADGLTTVYAGMDALEPSTSDLIGAGYQMIADGASLLLNPQTFILPTRTYTFVVEEDAVRASQQLTQTAQIVEFPMPSFPEVLLSGTLGAALEELDPDDVFAGALGVFFLARDCDFTQLKPENDWATTANWISTCVGALDSDTLQGAAVEVAGKASGEAAEKAQKFVGGAASKAGSVVSKLAWLTITSAIQSTIDYIGDVGTEAVSEYPAWFVILTLNAPAAKWDDFAGTWCRADGSFCHDYRPGTVATAWGTSTIRQTGMMGDCFEGLGEDDPGSGAMVVYCPAGVPTPEDVPGEDIGLPPADDNVDFERLFVYQGFGNHAKFRQTDLAALSAQ